MTLVATGSRNSNPVGEPEGGPNARARAGAREGLESTWWAKIKHSDPFAGTPKSIGAIVDDTAKGGAVPGDHAWWVEAPGYVWRCTVSIPLTMVLLPLVWVAQSGRRVLGATVVYGTLRWGGVDVTAGGWWSLVDAWLILVVVSTVLVAVKHPRKRNRRSKRAPGSVDRGEVNAPVVRS
jgi:hypothetical protein